MNEIIDAVHQNENVAQLDYDEKRQEFDMVFYFDGLFNKLEKRYIVHHKKWELILNQKMFGKFHMILKILTNMMI
jgi:hypothetical protein